MSTSPVVGWLPLREGGGVYDQLASKNLHGWVVAAIVVSILLLPVGIASASTMAVLALLGFATLLLDGSARAVLTGAGPTRWLGWLLAFTLAWQALGLLVRAPFDPRSISVLYSGAAIAAMLPVLAAWLVRDPRLSERLLLLLFAAGSLAAALSILFHVADAILAGGLSLQNVVAKRLVPVGRAHHEILGAGGLAAALFAGVALWRSGRLFGRGVLPGLALLVLAIGLTQSRGPIVGLVLALAMAALVMRLGDRPKRLPLALALVLICFATPFGLVLAEPWIKGLVCSSTSGLCRVTQRQDVWATILADIPQRPWFGVGPAFRFPQGQVSHAHNGLLGLAFFFGVPMALLFAGILANGVAGALRAPVAGRFFALSSIFFSAAFVATDLANPFAFINTHYVFLWLPLMLGSIMGGQGIGLVAPAKSSPAPATRAG